MEVHANRLNSFVKQKRGKALKWPHPKTWKATPDTLAEAGFYFDPSPDDPDNVTCFMCNKQVTEWAEDDDPFDIHFDKCANVCAWANLRCGLRRDADSHGRFVFPDKSRLPTSKTMEKARLETFTAHGWKHDKNKKHMASSKKMAHAGFVFLPAEAGDDTGACLYCHVALGNWDEDDDPMQHHRNRNKPEDPCPFLALAFPSAPAKQSKTTKRSAKAKPLTHTDVLMPTKTYDGSDDDATVPFPVSVAKTSAKTPRKTASTSTAKTPRTVTRSLSKANLRNQDVSLSEDEEVTPPPKKRGRSKSVSRPKVSEDEERAASPAPATRKRRPTTAARSRSKSVSRPASVPEAANLFDDDDDDDVPQAGPQVPRKASRSRSKAPEERTDEEPARKPSRSRSKARSVEVEPDVDGGEEIVSRKPSRSKPKPKAADGEKEKEETKRPPSRSQSKPQPPPPDDASSDDGWFVAPLPPPPPARSRTKSAASRPKGKVPETGEMRLESEVDEPAPPPARSRTKSVSKPKGKAIETDVDEPVPPPARSRTKSVSRAKGKTQETDVDEPDVVSRKEQKKKQATADATETQRLPSKARSDVVDPVVRKPSRTKSKPSVVEDTEVKKPPSRAKAKPPPSDDESQEVGEMEMEMEQYLPPPSSQPPPPTEKASRSKPSSKVDGVAEESKAQRGRKPSSRSTSKSVLPKLEPAVPAADALEEEDPPAEPAVPPPSRTRKASTRSTSTAPPVSRNVSTAAKARTKTKRDPSPESLDMDVHPPPEYEQPEPVTAASLPRQGSKSKPASRVAGPSSSQTVDVPVSTSRKPESKAPPPQAQKPRSTSQAQPRAFKAQKDALQLDDQEEDSGSEEIGDGLPVVDISTDDDEPKATKTPAKAKGKGKTQAKENKPAVDVQEKRTLPPSQTAENQVIDNVDDDVEMAEVEESIQLEPDPLLATPPRTPAPTSSSTVADEPAQWTHAAQTSPEGFAFIPPLATDPFVDMESLSEAEQEMTVEEWIRYQMGIEYERFKRDGERQLGMFELRAEEVRRAIETL